MTPLSTLVPVARARAIVDSPARPTGAFVLYWMIAARRTDHNWALEHAIAWARSLCKPLVVLEALGCGHQWAAMRSHAFIVEGMADQRAAFSRTPVHYYPYVERRAGEGRGLLAALAEDACVVITDDHPGALVRGLLAGAARRLRTRCEAVDGCGLLPLRALQREFVTAASFRRALQRELPDQLRTLPRADPLRRLSLPAASIDVLREVRNRWPAADDLIDRPAALAELPIDHTVDRVALVGGPRAARARLREFVRTRLADYAERRSHPDDDASSGLSPWLHYGHLGVHAILREIAEHHDWSPAELAPVATGARDGWWGLPASTESFLDELVVWREIGFNFALHHDDVYGWNTLPTWARATLTTHAVDPRPERYELARLEAATTGDELWNAAQRQLLRTGTMHNYLRMLWGKKVLEWSAGPEQALANLVALNDRWAIDGRDPNSASGICWVFGRYDRPWGPERAIFGTVRFMSSQNTRRKLRVREYLERWSAEELK
jgi:deoxyribodipyrimidine photo-lyase